MSSAVEHLLHESHDGGEWIEDQDQWFAVWDQEMGVVNVRHYQRHSNMYSRSPLSSGSNRDYTVEDFLAGDQHPTEAKDALQSFLDGVGTYKVERK